MAKRKARKLLKATALAAGTMLAGCGSQASEEYPEPSGNPKGSGYDDQVVQTDMTQNEGVSTMETDPGSTETETETDEDAGLAAGHGAASLAGEPQGLGIRRWRRDAACPRGMTKSLFELEWMGGPAERHFRKIRPDVESMPWGTLDVRELPPLLVERARVSWTEACYNEYCTAAAFADLLGALLSARAPIDIIGMASDFVADEVLHVELTSRIAMELGGGAHLTSVDSRPPHVRRRRPGLDPIQRANELVVKTCCVGEAFSVPMLAGCLRSAIASPHPGRARTHRERRSSARSLRLSLSGVGRRATWTTPNARGWPTWRSTC